MPLLRMVPIALLAALLVSPAALASRAPTKKEKRAISAAFYKKHPAGSAEITDIRVSTKDRRFGAVKYNVALPNGSGDSKSIDAGTPVFTKKGKTGRVATVSAKAVPKAVGKDLGKKPARSNIRITGAYEATLTQPARCTRDGDFYSMHVYDPGRDIYYDLQSFEFRGTGLYSLRQVQSVAGLAIGNGATVHTHETTWGEADVEKGRAFIDTQSAGGVISATMGPQPPPEEDDPSQFVFVDGYWACG